MMTAKTALRCQVLTVAVVALGVCCPALGARPVGAADADVYVVTGGIQSTYTIGVQTKSSGYSVDTGSTCLGVGPVSGYVDTARDESGPCSAMTGTGNLDLTACSTGTMTADLQLTEPSGDVATFVGSGIVIGGVAVLAAAPAAHAGDGYRDPSTASPTYGTSVGLLVPQVDQRCSAGVTRFIYDPTIVGEY